MDIRKLLLALAHAAVVLALFATPVAAQTPTPRPPDGLEPRVWLPLVVKSGGPQEPTSVTLLTHQAVVQAGDPFFVELWAYDVHQVRQWDGTLYWPEPVRYLTVRYGDDLWNELVRTDESPYVRTYRVEVGQWSLLGASADEALLGLFTMLASDATDDAVMLSAHVEMQGQDYYSYQPFYAMACLCDYDGDGDRDLYDVMLVDGAVGCEYGDACYDPWYDIDGDRAITDEDVLIATLYWDVPCP